MRSLQFEVVDERLRGASTNGHVLLVARVIVADDYRLMVRIVMGAPVPVDAVPPVEPKPDVRSGQMDDLSVSALLNEDL